MIALAPAAEADLPALATRYAGLRAAARDPRTRDAGALAAQLGRLIAAGYRAAHIEDDGDRVGYALWREEPEDDRVFLRHFYLDPQARGRGLGRAAFAALRREAFPAGAAVTLDVALENPEAAAFWRALGFRPAATRCLLTPEVPC